MKAMDIEDPAALLTEIAAALKADPDAIEQLPEVARFIDRLTGDRLRYPTLAESERAARDEVCRLRVAIEALAQRWEERAAQYQREHDAGQDAHNFAQTNAYRWQDAAAELRAARNDESMRTWVEDDAEHFHSDGDPALRVWYGGGGRYRWEAGSKHGSEATAQAAKLAAEGALRMAAPALGPAPTAGDRRLVTVPGAPSDQPPVDRATLGHLLRSPHQADCTCEGMGTCPCCILSALLDCEHEDTLDGECLDCGSFLSKGQWTRPPAVAALVGLITEAARPSSTAWTGPLNWVCTDGCFVLEDAAGHSYVIIGPSEGGWRVKSFRPDGGAEEAFDLPSPTSEAEAERRITAALAVKTHVPLSVKGLSGTVLEMRNHLLGIDSPTTASVVSQALNERLTQAELKRDCDEREVH